MVGTALRAVANPTAPRTCIGVVRKLGYASRDFAKLDETSLDASQRSFARAVRRVRAQRRAAGGHFAGPSLAPEARRVSPRAVAAGQPAARRPARRPLPGRVVPLPSSDQR